MNRTALRELVTSATGSSAPTRRPHVVDGIKGVGFEYATRGGMTIAVDDIVIPTDKAELLGERRQARSSEIEERVPARPHHRGRALRAGRRRLAADDRQTVSNAMMDGLDAFGAVQMMSDSGARGNKGQISQLGGMRGLMADPSGRIIDVPVRSNFREGMTVLEYFISTHGARKGLADTALRTADSGYLTRRLVDVAQDVITREEDCGTPKASGSPAPRPRRSPATSGRLRRSASSGGSPPPTVVDAADRRVLVDRNEEITEAIAAAIDAAGHRRVLVRSPLSCEARHGVCRACYGRNLATGRLVEIGEAVGIIAAQSIGEPGTQLTMRTFHTGGVAGLDITAGLPRVEELFEARVPKGKAEISHIDGIVEIIAGENGARKVKRHQPRAVRHTTRRPSPGQELLRRGRRPGRGRPGLARGDGRRDRCRPCSSPAKGMVVRDGDGSFAVRAEDVVEREYPSRTRQAPRRERRRRSAPATPITDGPINPQEYLETRGREAVQRYLVKEVQKVYRSQGVTINDKHIEIIVRQMLRKVRIDQPGDTDLLPGELIDRFDFEEVNNQVLAEGGEPATAQTVLLGVTKASLNTELPGGGLLPGDDPGADRGGHQRREGPPDRPQGERHHRQAHPGRERAPGEHRRAPRGGAAGRRRGARRRGAARGSAGQEYNPFLEGRAPTEERSWRRGSPERRPSESRSRSPAREREQTRSSPSRRAGRRAGRSRHRTANPPPIKGEAKAERPREPGRGGRPNASPTAPRATGRGRAR